VAARTLEVGDRLLVDREKNPIVSPYSGAMLAIVARSVTHSEGVPSPEELDELGDHLLLRSISVMVSTRSVWR